MGSQKKWINRSHDERSRPFILAFVVMLSFIGSAFVVLVSGTASYFLDPSSYQNSPPFVMTFVLSFLAFNFVLYFMIRLIPNIVRDVWPNSVDMGHKGLIKFRGVYTGEVAEAGVVVAPFGYSYEEMDCRPFERSTGSVELVSVDGFPVTASLSAWFEFSDAMKYVSSNPNKLIIPLLTSSLSLASSKSNILSIVGDRERLIKIVKSDIDVDFLEWGLDLYRVALDFKKVPDSVSELISMLDILKEKHPDRTTSELADLIMTASGKVTVNRSHSTNVSRIEVPSIDNVIELAIQKFG